MINFKKYLTQIGALFIQMVGIEKGLQVGLFQLHIFLWTMLTKMDLLLIKMTDTPYLVMIIVSCYGS